MLPESACRVFGVIKVMTDYKHFEKAFNEDPQIQFAEISDDEKSEAQQRLELLADEAREDLA